MTITINCGAINTMSEFHEMISHELDFPDWYGNNLDALYDCLTDITEDCSIVLTNVLPWFEKCGKKAITTVRLMQDVSQINPNFKFFFGNED